MALEGTQHIDHSLANSYSIQHHTIFIVICNINIDIPNSLVAACFSGNALVLIDCFTLSAVNTGIGDNL